MVNRFGPTFWHLSPGQWFHNPYFLFYWIATPLNSILLAFEALVHDCKFRRPADVKAKVRFTYGAMLTGWMLPTSGDVKFCEAFLGPLEDYMTHSKERFIEFGSKGSHPEYVYFAKYPVQAAIIGYTHYAIQRLEEDKLNKWFEKTQTPFVLQQ